MSVTIKDVAKKANVSTATVSLVLNDNKRISAETKKKVLKAIEELNYHPTRSARDLVSKITGNIGFILTDNHFLRTEPFYTKIFLGTEFEARDFNYYVLLTTVNKDFSEEDPLPRFVLEKSVDGVLLAGKVPQLLIDKLNEYDLPIVFIDYFSKNEKWPVVQIDNINGGMTATEHLIDMGHTNIGFIGGDIEHPSINRRLHGYKMALYNAGIEFDESRVDASESNTDRVNGYSAVKKLMKNKSDITAIFACNDAMAIGAIRGLNEMGKKVPDDISIIGFDDVEADLMIDPPLSTIRVPKYEIGIEAMRLIVEVVTKKSVSNKKVLVPVELIKRKSVKRKK